MAEQQYYQIPDSFSILRDWLARQGLDLSSLKSERQAAFMAQQIAGTRFKFPPKGESCRMVLAAIQDALPKKATGETLRSAIAERSQKQAFAEGTAAHGAPTDWKKGLVIFCDGACEPNPGAGGWGFVVYRDGIDIHTDYGGADPTTNNIMEMTAALMALRWFADYGVIEPARLLCDSQYVVKGCNEWRHGWKRKGWRRGVEKELANVELWRELDEALTLVPITLEWCKGHAGIVGNERADELSLIGRNTALSTRRVVASIQR